MLIFGAKIQVSLHCKQSKLTSLALMRLFKLFSNSVKSCETFVMLWLPQQRSIFSHINSPFSPFLQPFPNAHFGVRLVHNKRETNQNCDFEQSVLLEESTSCCAFLMWPNSAINQRNRELQKGEGGEVIAPRQLPLHSYSTSAQASLQASKTKLHKPVLAPKYHLLII